ncbi:MAG: flagellar biosynthesis protein FliL [SAR116 cluster bacterium]|jgi:flagellar FliL protein|nr:flagellar biosynthesis protein FliL [SAR116 cluster bacterium]
MAEVKEEEQSGKGGLIKILLFSLGAILLLCIGLGIGYFLFGGEPETDPSQEVNQIIEGESNKKAENKEEDTEGEEVGEDGIIKKNVKAIPEVDAYETSYFEFPGDFTTNLKNSRKFLQVSVGVSTQYDEKVMEIVDQHQLALRSVILTVISDFTEEDISGSNGKDKLADSLLVAMNKKLDQLKEFPGIEGVYFTSFVVQ